MHNTHTLKYRYTSIPQDTKFDNAITICLLTKLIWNEKEGGRGGRDGQEGKVDKLSLNQLELNNLCRICGVTLCTKHMQTQTKRKHIQVA